MATAIDKIKEAEQQAADIRAGALQKSRDDLRAAQEQILKEQKEKFNSARKKVRGELEEAERSISDKRGALSEENEKLKKEYRKRAESGVKAAAEIIVKGILDI
jgi:vacuolar-type H+-ATPase subunit H